MTPAEIDDLRYRIDAEGFDYCFTGYSNWDEISDEEFQRLRKAYCDAADALKKYLKVDEFC